MTDIVERLRTSTEWAHCKHSMREEAAAEIERLHKIELQFLALQEERVRWFADNEWLTADNEQLRAVCKPFADALSDGERHALSPSDLLDCCRNSLTLYEFGQARRALEPKP